MELHRDEYDELRRDVMGEEIESLHATIARLKERVTYLEGQNPQGANVPALTETIKMLSPKPKRLRRQRRFK